MPADLSRATWRKSTRSHTNGCVEVAMLDGGWVAVRDSKESRGPVLMFTAHEWRAFLGAVQAGEFGQAANAEQATARFDAASGESARLNGMAYP